MGEPFRGNTMTEKKVLVIEDNIAEAIYAQLELTKAGCKEFRAVTTLSEGLDIMHQYGAVLSDLFFPAGNVPTGQYVQYFLPFYVRYKEKRFEKIRDDNVVLRAVKACAEVFEVTPQEYVNTVMANLNTPPVILKAAKDSLAGIQDSEKYANFLQIEEGIRSGTNLPLGIIACERASGLGIPAVIVTSTYHHDDAFEPVKDLLKVPYRDTLVDGRKDWKGGIELLLR